MAVLLAAGCGQTYYPDALDVTLEEVDKIRNSSTLEPEDMRDELAEYGIDEVTMNGLLADVRLANQFGGDLFSAYDKVVDGQMSEMTPDEVQFYGDATDVTTYEDDEAQLIVDLFQEYDINTQSDLEDFLEDEDSDLPADIDEDNLQEVFIDTSTDDVRDEL